MQRGAESQLSSKQTNVWFIKPRALNCCLAAEEVCSKPQNPLAEFQTSHNLSKHTLFSVQYSYLIHGSFYFSYFQRVTASFSQSCPKSNVSATTREKVWRYIYLFICVKTCWLINIQMILFLWWKMFRQFSL